MLARTIQSDGCGWGSGMSGGSSARSPRCRSGELLLLESPASDAGTRPPGLLAR